MDDVIEEERRLLYVAITRAKHFLFPVASAEKGFFADMIDWARRSPMENEKDPFYLKYWLDKVPTYRRLHKAWSSGIVATSRTDSRNASTDLKVWPYGKVKTSQAFSFADPWTTLSWPSKTATNSQSELQPKHDYGNDLNEMIF